MYLYDDEEQSQVQFVGFVGEHSRYDLMLVQTDRHYGKTGLPNELDLNEPERVAE